MPGRDAKIQFTNIFKLLILDKLLRGLNARIVLNALIFGTPGISPNQPLTTTRKSIQFHPSCS